MAGYHVTTSDFAWAPPSQLSLIPMTGSAILYGRGAEVLPAAITSVTPAASRANMRAINKRSIREVMFYILLGSALRAGMGALMNTSHEMQPSRK
jgi:hypothetical protein